MSIDIDPFSSSKILAEWSSQVLIQQGIDQISKWRMVEYWMQVELYRAIEYDNAVIWQHFGDFEQPYYTAIPRSGSKYNIKWVDLVFAKPELKQPEQILWIELKDIGRSPHTIVANSRGLGQDLSALYTLDPSKTKSVWINPPEHVVDRGRTQEWKQLSEGIVNAKHLIAQIVLVPISFTDDDGTDLILGNWLTTFKNRTEHLKHDPKIDIQLKDTSKFKIFALVMKPFCEIQ